MHLMQDDELTVKKLKKLSATLKNKHPMHWHLLHPDIAAVCTANAPVVPCTDRGVPNRIKVRIFVGDFGEWRRVLNAIKKTDRSIAWWLKSHKGRSVWRRYS